MKEMPILFSGSMVRAILAGSKTQTRRVMKPQPPSTKRGRPWASTEDLVRACPYGVRGSRLWVRETFQPIYAPGVSYRDTDWTTGKGFAPRYMATEPRIEWMDPDDNLTTRCKPAIHMPRWASRLTLEVTEVRVQRLQEITYDDMRAEGLLPTNVCGGEQAALQRDYFAPGWDSINGKRAPWASNPWAWAITFKRIDATA